MNSYNGFTPAQRYKALRWGKEQDRLQLRPKPTICDACGQTKGVLERHSEDYSEPFELGKTGKYVLCYRCHMMVHCRFKNPDAWALYRARIMLDGIMYAPFLTRNWHGFVQEHLEKWAPRVEMEGLLRAKDVLKEIEDYPKPWLDQ